MRVKRIREGEVDMQTIEIKANFTRSADAEAAQNKLRALRIENTAINENTAGDGGFLGYNGDPAWFNLGNLSTMSMMSYSTSMMTGLYAAGYNAMNEASRQFQLSAVVPDSVYHQAKMVIEAAGGSLQ